MDLDLNNKVALVTGSSAGIGLAIARELAQEGCKVVLNGRNEGALLEAKQSIPGSQVVVADLTNDADCHKLIEETLGFFGRLELLVTNVGSGASVSPGKENRQEWDRLLELNLHSATQVIRAAYDHLAKTQGSILCISSICGHEALGCPIAYAGAKAALNAFVSNFARFSGKDNVRINALLPGNILFPGSVWERKLNENKEQVEEMLAREVPLKKLGTAQDVSKMAAFLLSPMASFVTGSRVIVDGGQTRT